MPDINTPILILGAGGFAREVLWLLEDLGLGNRVAGFVSDHTSLAIGSLKCFASDEEALLMFPRGTSFVAAVGDGMLRKTLFEKYFSRGWNPLTIVHPSASVSPRATIEKGSIICAGARVSSDTELGSGCVVNLNACIGHDSMLGDFCTLHPGSVVNGSCSMGTLSELGTNAALHPGVNIGESTIIGMGAMVIRDLPGGVVAVGTPAKIIRQR